MLRTKRAHIVFLAIALLLIDNCSAYCKHGVLSRSSGYRAPLFAGFGPVAPKADKQSGPDAPVNPQLKSINIEAKCPCSSGLTYKNCCKIHHDGTNDIRNLPDPESLTRARYSSFAVGLASYVIDTSHPAHRDYKRHTGSNLDPKKARRAWEKEIITKNSEVFDFLKLELLSGDEKINQKANETLAAGEESVAFRILVRKRSDGSLITFQESSVYVPRPVDYVPLGLKAPSSGKYKENKEDKETKENKENREKSVPDDAEKGSSTGWLYHHGTVTPVAEDIAKRILGEAPQFLNNLSIRDRW